MDIQKGVNMNTRIVRVVEIPKAGEREDGQLVTRFAREFTKAKKLRRGEALELSYSRKRLAFRARESICAVVRRKKLRYKVAMRGRKVYIIRK